MSEQKPPLWRVMRVADSSCASDFTSPEAKAIIAVRDWIKKARPNYDEVLHGVIRADELDSILALLTTEADRAERGD